MPGPDKYFGQFTSDGKTFPPPARPRLNRYNSSGDGRPSLDRKRQHESAFPASPNASFLNQSFLNKTVQFTPEYAIDSNECLNNLKESAAACFSEVTNELSLFERGNPIDPRRLNHAYRLLNDEAEKLKFDVNSDWMDLQSPESKITLKKRVLLPPDHRPGGKIAGRLLGKGGSTLKKICQTYRCSIRIAGAGSQRNPEKEAELLQSGNSAHAHYALPLHVEISITDPPHQAYERFGRVLSLIYRAIHMTESFQQDGIMVVSLPSDESREFSTPSKYSRPPIQKYGSRSEIEDKSAFPTFGSFEARQAPMMSRRPNTRPDYQERPKMEESLYKQVSPIYAQDDEPYNVPQSFEYCADADEDRPSRF